MRSLQKLALVVTAAALILALPLTAGAVVLNEIRLDQPGSDVDEYVELAGTPGESLDGVSLIVLGDGSSVFDGVVEEITDLTGNVIQPDGLFLMAEATFTLGGTVDLVTDLNLENSDNVTYMLVRDLNPAINVGSGFGGSDLDADDDNVIDPTGDYDGDTIDDGAPFSSEIDCVALIETVGSGDFVYCSTQVGPDGSFVPGHVYYCATTGWVIGPFDPVGGDDTPDADNVCPTPVEDSSWGHIKSLND